MLWKCCTQYASKFGKLSSGHRPGKDKFSFQSPKMAMPKNAQTTTQLCSFHMPARSCSKSFKLGFKRTWTEKFSDVQAGFLKGRGTRDHIAKLHWNIEKARKFQKTIYFRFIDHAKAFDCVNQNKMWKILREVEYQTTLPVSWEICMQVKKQQLEWDMEQQTGSGLGKEYIKAVVLVLLLLDLHTGLSPAYLTYMQRISLKNTNLDDS